VAHALLCHAARAYEGRLQNSGGMSPPVKSERKLKVNIGNLIAIGALALYVGVPIGRTILSQKDLEIAEAKAAKYGIEKIVFEAACSDYDEDGEEFCRFSTDDCWIKEKCEQIKKSLAEDDESDTAEAE
jgi:hypothetical protein